MDKMPLKGVIDMHVHTNPDLRVRRYDDFELCDAAVRVGARALVIKTHLGSTAERAYLVNRYNKLTYGDNDFTMFGSLTLNRCVGGINPTAVENALKLGAKVIWLPTLSARNHLEKAGKSTGGCVDVVKDGQILPELAQVLKLIKDYDAVLGTGHISVPEIFTVVGAARQLGVEKIVVTHPEWWLINMSLEQQVEIVQKYNVVLERCFAQNQGIGSGNGYRSNLRDNLEIIREVGYQNVLISTDGGQVENPSWELEEQEYLQYLADHGVPQNQIRCMSHDLPAALLGIDE